MKTAHTKLAQSGSTITVAIVTVSLLGVFVSLAVEYTSTIARNAQRDRVFNNAVEIGDGCLELAFGGWRKLSASVEAPPTASFGAIPPLHASYFPSFPEAQISNFRVQAVTPLMELQSDNPPISILPTSEPPTKTTGPGDGTYSYFYLATVDVTLPYARGNLTAKVRRIFEKRYTSAWNWAMLYNEDLELHPDSPLTLNGWVHSNEDIFVGNGTTSPTPSPTPTPDPSATPDPFPTPTPTPSPTATPNLVLTDRLTYAGNYTVGFHPDDLDHAGQTNIADAVSPADLPPGSEQIYYPFGWRKDLFNTTDSNVNNDGFREMIEKPATGVGVVDVVSSERIYNQANLAIEIDASNNVRVYSGTGPSKSEVTSSSGNSYGAKAYGNRSNFVKPGYFVQDNREAANVRVVNFDVAEFIKQFPSSTTSGWNGIVHIRDNSATSSTRRGIRVVNGATIPNGGITIVSDNPVYIQGDYNTGRTSSTETPSNIGNFDDPDVAGYTRQPSAIMADAITLLSNNWQDGNGAKGVLERVATNTTINAALVAGNVPTSGGRYSGGGENFVRFLEDWTGKNFTYYGSMMGMYASTQSTGYWGKDNVYEPPNLKWYFDKRLSVDENGNPVAVPGYVSTVAYLQQQRWYLQY